MLKIELHTHTADDPVDAIPYTTFELIDHAAGLGYDALAITLHEHQLDLRRFLPYAAERGIVLIPGVERTVEGRHVLLLNYKSGTEQVRSFADLAALKRRASGLVIAPTRQRGSASAALPWSFAYLSGFECRGQRRAQASRAILGRRGGPRFIPHG